jgi:hypothetical protein
MRKNWFAFWVLLPAWLCAIGLWSRHQFLKEDETWLQSLYTNIQVKLGNQTQNGVCLGESALYVLPESLSDAGLQQTAENINTFYTTYQIPTCVIAVPDAAAFYADSLPSDVQLYEQKPQMQQFYNAIDVHIQKTDAYYILESKATDYIYYRTMPYWTSYGAYNVYRSAIQKMGFVPISYDHYVVSHVQRDVRGELYQQFPSGTVTPDLLDIYENESGDPTLTLETGSTAQNLTKTDTLYDTDALLSENPYNFYLGESAPLQIITTDLENGKQLLVLKDEWADCMIPFLAQHYQKICLVDVRYATALTELVPDLTAYQQVLFLCHTDTYAASTLFDAVLS